jgi:HD superfamily phosphohydrolase
MRIYDNIHGYIDLDPIASAIVNTDIFQRLRNIHQTGVLYLVFPTATHTRFEHSIGTYHLAKQMITMIATKQPELKVTDEIITLVSIAGLCHDLGHLLFSHLFDDSFIETLPNINMIKTNTSHWCHENRSISLLNYIVEKHKISLNKDQLKVIADLINPKESDYNKWKPKYMIGRWIFQIISNPLNSIDVDKFDYLTRDTMAVGLKLGFDYSRIMSDARVIENNGKTMICYSSQCSEDIYHMFFIRYRLHRQIYNHKAVKAIEILIIQLLFELEKEMNISEYIMDPEKMILLTDNFVMSSHMFTKNEIVKNIISNINMRILPKMVYQEISLNNIEFDINKLEDQFKGMYQVVRFKVGYVGGNKNPLNKIYFYNFKTGNIISENKVKNFSLLINQKHQEYFLRVYCLNIENLDMMKQLFDNNENNLIDV